MLKRSFHICVLIALVLSLGIASVNAQDEIDCKGAQPGDTVSMLYQWSGQEEQKISEILAPLADACGIVFQPESTRDQALLDTKVQAGTPPDVAFWTLAAAIRYRDQLQAMDELGAVAENYADFFVATGTIDDKWVALPVKADIKTIIWYSPIVFEAKGYEVPATWDELVALVDQMVANGDVPWSMGFESGDATGWTGQDFIQDILLTTQGPDYVAGIIDGSIPFNDEGVREAFEIYGGWAKDPAYTVGGAEGTLSTGFVPAIYNVFTDPPEAMMVKQSGFAGGEIQAQYPDLVYGEDYDFFNFPGAQGLQGGADLMIAFSNSPAVQALVAYLSSEVGAVKWAEVGFDLTPNLLGAGHYVDPALMKKGDALAATGGLIPSMGDAIPGGFARAEWGGIVNFVNGEDLDAQLDNIAAAQAEALANASS
jgi:alpha-glucoside transport system substrate-binding protein